jgi:hypothetical protein
MLVYTLKTYGKYWIIKDYVKDDMSDSGEAIIFQQVELEFHYYGYEIIRTLDKTVIVPNTKNQYSVVTNKLKSGYKPKFAIGDKVQITTKAEVYTVKSVHPATTTWNNSYGLSDGTTVLENRLQKAGSWAIVKYLRLTDDGEIVRGTMKIPRETGKYIQHIAHVLSVPVEYIQISSTSYE